MPPPSPAKGIALMILSVLLFSGMDATVKWLGATYPVPETMVFRALFGCLPVLAVVAALRRPALLAPGDWKVHLMRGGMIVGAQMSFFTGVTLMPLADAIALAFSAPLFVTALSVPLLDEPVGARRWTAVTVGFLGVLVIATPGEGVISLGAGLVLLGALFYALLMLTARRNSHAASSYALTFYASLVPLPVAAALVPVSGWVTPGWGDLGLYLAVGLLGGSAALSLTAAFRHAPAAVIAPFEYMSLLWATLIGWLVWAEWPAPEVWIGVALVAASGLYILYRETRTARPPVVAEGLDTQPPGS